MTLPEEIATRAATVLEERSPESAQLLKSAPIDVQQSALRVFAGSDFVVDSIVRDAQLLPQLLARASSQLGGALPLLHRSAVSGGDENQFMSALRLWRRAELTRIAWRDLAGWSPLSETLWALSQAADKAIAAAQQHAWATLVSRHGPPDLPPGEAQQLIIIAMGKLGGWELNFSSDVDLVFLFDGHGETTGALPITHEEFFLKLGQRVIRYLDALTAEGRAYRVDMRLRPFGASGPLVASVAAFEDYLERQGRDWERYAWIKARAVTGGTSYAEVFRSSVQPFVYRRYLDFGVFEALREMKNLIEREVERRDLRDNIKLGPGGIREIEFIVQALQLIRGGSDRRLQNSSLLETLPRLAGARMLPAEATSELAAAYEFLRRLENRLQMLQDQQTHSLPADPLARSRVAFAMNFGSWEELSGALQGHRQQVAAHFAALVKTEGRSPSPKTSLNALFDREDFRAALATHLCAMGMLDAADAPPVAQLFQDLQNSPLVRRMDPAGRRRLGALLELMVDEVVPRPGSLATLRRLLRVVEAIGTRSAYFALLSENPLARRRLTDLASHGDFLTAQIAAFPVLLDELIDERLFDELPTRAQLAADLVERLSDVADGDEQLQVERLRHLQRAALFRIAAADLSGRLPLMAVSDRLTEVAELIVEQALRISWQFVTAQYGTPMCGAGAERRAVHICAIGYGKLGGMELSYSSDLDLVFLHDSSGEQQETQATSATGRSVDNQVFFVRFVQRLVHTLTMHSAAGRLYEVDMRLRPSGKGGMLITSIQAFEDYQRQEAWTWEHQALLHARVISGPKVLREHFAAMRTRVLEQYVRHETLRDEVRRMRERMRGELSAAKPEQFDLKQDPGGIADIEFLAQYWALRWARDYPPVAWFADTIRELESVASAALVPQLSIDVLTAAYRRYRERSHHLAIAGLPAVVSAQEFIKERAAVTALWRETMNVEDAGILIR